MGNPILKTANTFFLFVYWSWFLLCLSVALIYPITVLILWSNETKETSLHGCKGDAVLFVEI